jgi:MinD-like ATPase involved in chromosome partitioning or flagellar assembly
MAEELKLKFLGDLIFETKIAESEAQKIPITIAKPNSELSMLYDEIANKLAILAEIKWINQFVSDRK